MAIKQISVAGLLSPREYALKFHKSLSYVFHLLWAGRLPATFENGRWYIGSSKLDQSGKSLTTVGE